MSGIKSSLDNFFVGHAVREIKDVYGDNVTIKPKSLLKFGRNDDVGLTTEMVWLRGGTETLATGNTIDTVSSTDVGDTQMMRIEGHTLSGSDLTFVVQDVTLDGQNKSTLTTPLYRSTRIFNIDSTDLAGTVYVYEDTAISGGVPSDSTKIHLQTDGTNNQSLKAATSFSSVDYGIITSLQLGVTRQQSRSVDFQLQVRESGGVFRTRWTGSAHSSGGSVNIPLEPYLIIPPNSDVRIMAISSGTGTGVTTSFNALLGLVQS